MKPDRNTTKAMQVRVLLATNSVCRGITRGASSATGVSSAGVVAFAGGVLLAGDVVLAGGLPVLYLRHAAVAGAV